MQIQSQDKQQLQSRFYLQNHHQENLSISSQSDQLKHIKTLTYPKNIQIPVLFNPHQHHPILTKVKAYTNHFYSAYSDGKIFKYSFNQSSIINSQENFKLENVICPYHNTDVFDFEVLSNQNILCCTHTQATYHDVVKEKSLNLRGHEQTVVAVAAHPHDSLVISVSNNILHHDLRIGKPIMVNFITPPVFGLQYFKNGKFFLMSGQPCRISNFKYQRTLQNGIGKVSPNGNFILMNSMNSKINLWDWKTSKKILSVDNVKNTINYQPIFYKISNQKTTGFLFLQDDGVILDYDFQTKMQKKLNAFSFQAQKQSQIKHSDLFYVEKKIAKIENIAKQNWKMEVNMQGQTARILLYEHESACIRFYQL